MASQHLPSLQPSLQQVSRFKCPCRARLIRKAAQGASDVPVTLSGKASDSNRAHPIGVSSAPTSLSRLGRLDGKLPVSLRLHQGAGRRCVLRRVLAAAREGDHAKTPEDNKRFPLSGLTTNKEYEGDQETVSTQEMTMLTKDEASRSAGFLAFATSTNAAAITVGLSLGVALLAVLSHPDLARALEGSHIQIHDHQHAGLDSDLRALALGPGGPLMEDFWDNMRRYVLYFFTVATGGAYTLVKPIVDLMRRPATAVLVVVVATGVFYLTYVTLDTMLGLNQDFDYLYSQ